MTKNKSTLLRFDAVGALIPDHGISQEQLAGLQPQLEQVRTEMLQSDLPMFDNGSEVPVEKQPLDAGFHELPERILDQYRSQGTESELGQILATADRLKQAVDRVVVLGIGGSYMGARALMESCCQPYYNEYSRAERGGRPRIYFEGNNVDNDWSQGLLHLLRTQTDDLPWAIVVISKSGGTMETAVALRQFLAEMSQTIGSDRLPELVVPITGQTGQAR